MVNFYYYNEGTGLFEDKGDYKVANGAIVVELAHCSTYVITANELSGDLVLDETVAYLAYACGGWYPYANTDGRTEVAGVKYTTARVTDYGTYTVGIDFTDFGQTVTGTEYMALIIEGGESLFPYGDGAVIDITSFKVNGAEIPLNGLGATTGADGNTVLYIFNQWANAISGRTEILGYGDGASQLVTQAQLTDVKSIEITFNYVDGRVYGEPSAPSTGGGSSTSSESGLEEGAATLGRLIYVPGDWSAAFWGFDSPDTYNMDGVVAKYAQITGPGSYSTSLDFTGTAAGSFDGVEFAALYIDNGEMLFPGFTVQIDEILVNGEPVSFAKPYTTSEDGLTTRVNLYNVWVLEWISGRTPDGNMDGATSVILTKDQLQGVKTIQVNFTYVATEGYTAPNTGAETSNSGLYVVMFAAVIAAGTAFVYRRKTRENM